MKNVFRRVNEIPSGKEYNESMSTLSNGYEVWLLENMLLLIKW